MRHWEVKTKNRARVDVSIILVNWNCEDVISNCLKSLTNTIKKSSYEIIVVDNNSHDNSLELIEEEYPQVKIIKNDFNNYFAGANNQGYEASRGDFIFILNSDTIATTGAVDKLVDFAKKNNQGAVTCTLLNKDGSVQYNMHRQFPSAIKLFAAFLYKKYNGFWGLLPGTRKYLLLDNKFDKDFYVEQAAAAALLLSRDLVEKLDSLFDDKKFPLFYNDVDLCYRIHELGRKVLCKTDVYIYHLKGESIKKVDHYEYLASYAVSVINFFKKHRLHIDYFLVSTGLKLLFLFLYPLPYISYCFGRISKEKLDRKSGLIRRVLRSEL